MKRILVAGGAGFIGSNLCKQLLEEDNYVISLDNLYTGNMSNIDSLLSNDNFEFINHNVIFPIDLDNIDEIYNLACPASPVKYQSSPTYTMKTAFLGTMNLLDLARKNNAKILQFSTSEIYGNPKVHPQKENYLGNVSTKSIRACYDEGKRAGETLCFDYNREFKTRVKVIRVFNTYGPNMDINDGRAVSNMINQALANKDITVYGDGKQTRSFCYIDDLLLAIKKTMATEDDFVGPLNLGNPEEITINELANTIVKLTNSKSKIIHIEKPKDDPLKRKPDISLAKNKLDKWDLSVFLEEGLKLTINFFEKKANS